MPEPIGGQPADPQELVPNTQALVDAIVAMHKHGIKALPILDRKTGTLVGTLGRAPDDPRADSPPDLRLGGMATPLGVYLTDGLSSGGAGFFGLLLSGSLLGVMGLLATVVADHFSLAVEQAVLGTLSHASGWSMLAGPITIWVAQLLGILPVFLMLVILRLLPLSGTHAAEHQVVHCVERGIPLTPAWVKQMPRVHPRCGTNLLVGLYLFLTVFVGVFRTSIAFHVDEADAAALGAMCAAPVAVIYWRRLGALAQYWLATKTPTDKQIASAISAAHEVLRRRALTLRLDPPRFRVARRIWNMGLTQVACGCGVVYGFLRVLLAHWPLLGALLAL